MDRRKVTNYMLNYITKPSYLWVKLMSNNDFYFSLSITQMSEFKSDAD